MTIQDLCEVTVRFIGSHNGKKLHGRTCYAARPLVYSRDRRTAVYHGVLRAAVRTSNIHESKNPIPQSISKIASLFFGVDCELKGKQRTKTLPFRAIASSHQSHPSSLSFSFCNISILTPKNRRVKIIP